MEEKICRYFHCILTWDISKFTSKTTKTTYSKIVTSNLDVSIRVFIAYAGSLPPRGPILLVMAYRRMRSSLTYITNIRSIRSSSVSSPLRGPWEQSLNVMFCLTWKVWVSAPFSADTTVNSRTDVEVITENRKKGKSLEESNSQQTLGFNSRPKVPQGLIVKQPHVQQHENSFYLGCIKIRHSFLKGSRGDGRRHKIFF